MLALWGGFSGGLCFKVSYRPIESGKLGIVDLGNIDAKSLTHGRHEVEEVHGVDIEDFAQIGRWIDGADVNLGRDVAQGLLDYGSNIETAHSEAWERRERW